MIQSILEVEKNGLYKLNISGIEIMTMSNLFVKTLEFNRNIIKSIKTACSDVH